MHLTSYTGSWKTETALRGAPAEASWFDSLREKVYVFLYIDCFRLRPFTDAPLKWSHHLVISRPLGSTTESSFLSSRWDFYHLEHGLMKSRHSSKSWMGWGRESCMSTEKWRNLRILKVSAMSGAISLEQCKSLLPVYTGLLHWFSNTRNAFDPLTPNPEGWELSFVWWLPFSFGLVIRAVCHFKEFYIKRSKQKISGTEEQAAGGQFNLTLLCGHIAFFIVPRRAFLSRCSPVYLSSPTCLAQQRPAVSGTSGEEVSRVTGLLFV